MQYYSESLLSHFVGISQSIHRDLLTVPERDRFYAEHNADHFNRGATDKRNAAYATGKQNGWLSVNDIRRKENMNPIEGGDVYLVQPGYIPMDMLVEFVLSQMASKSEAPKRSDSLLAPSETNVSLQVSNDIRKESVVKHVKVWRDEQGEIRAESLEQPEEKP